MFFILTIVRVRFLSVVLYTHCFRSKITNKHKQNKSTADCSGVRKFHWLILICLNKPWQNWNGVKKCCVKVVVRALFWCLLGVKISWSHAYNSATFCASFLTFFYKNLVSCQFYKRSPSCWVLVLGLFTALFRKRFYLYSTSQERYFSDS